MAISHHMQILMVSGVSAEVPSLIDHWNVLKPGTVLYPFDQGDYLLAI